MFFLLYQYSRSDRVAKFFTFLPVPLDPYPYIPYRITRKVNLDATVSIDNLSYDVPMQFIRSNVEIRFLPNRMQDAYILSDGIHYPIRPTNRVENGRTKRNNTHAIDYSKMGPIYV